MAYVAVKVYRNNEIRRYILERGEDNRFSFQDLIKGAQQAFNDLTIPSAKVMWKDTDGELIRMSSSSELMEAIRALPSDNPVLKIYLSDKSTDQQQQQDQPEPIQEDDQQKMQTDQKQQEEQPVDVDPTLHRGVFCDGCQNSIHGIRHKCLTCPDYDLCSACVEKEMHDEHPMIRIVSPNDKTWKPAFIASQGPFPFMLGMHRGRRCGRGGGHCHGQGPQQAEEEKKKDEQPPAADQEEFTRNLSQTINTVLSALGISTPSGASASPQANADTGMNPGSKIEAALNYMLAMGYRNDGGWLTKLLEEKGGDVSAVLDVLHPKN